jgi:hypothetical protein
MPFTADVINEIASSSLQTFLDKGQVFKQNIANKPMLDAFDSAAGQFTGGKDVVDFAVSAGQGGGALSGYTADDQVTYYNPTGTKRAKFPWKEHHIGIVFTHTEMKENGVDIVESGTKQTPRDMADREVIALANMLDEKNEMMGEDYSFSLDRLIHGDGSTDAKALAGIQSLILDVPNAGTTGTIGRGANVWWRNRAATAAYGVAGGQGAITSATANGGALIEFLEKEWLLLSKYKKGATKVQIFAGSDWRAAYMKELRANGNYTLSGFQGQNNADGGMDDPKFKGTPIIWDPTLDDLGLSKRAYFLDTGKRGIRLLYMDGQRMKQHNPARPYDRYVTYQGITTTAVMIARQLNTSAVYDIA